MTPRATATLALALRQKAFLLVVAILLLAAVCALIFGPARGARDDIGQVRTDLHASRHDIDDTLSVARTTLDGLLKELGVTQQALEVARRGLAVARDSGHVAHVALDATETIRRQTGETLATVKQVVSALGPLKRLQGDIHTVVAGVQTGVTLARTTLGIARQTLRTGQSALAIAATTLGTLQDSLGVQRQLLAIARQTLHQATEINRKIPVAPVFPTAGP